MNQYDLFAYVGTVAYENAQLSQQLKRMQEMLTEAQQREHRCADDVATLRNELAQAQQALLTPPPPSHYLVPDEDWERGDF